MIRLLLLLALTLGTPVLAQDSKVRFAPWMNIKIPGGGVHSLAFSQNGRQLATGGEWGDLVLWDVATREEIATFDVSDHWIGAVAFSPDGRFLAGLSAELAVYEIATGKKVLQHGADSMHALAFSADGHLAFYDDGRIVLFEPKLQHAVARLKVPSARRLAFEGRRLVVGGTDGVLRTYSLAAGKLVTSFARPKLLQDMARLGDEWITVHQNGEICLGSKKRLSFGKRATDVAVAPDGKRFAVAGQDGLVCIYDRNGKKTASQTEHPVWANDVAFSPDGRLLATAGNEDGALLWRDGKVVARLVGNASEVRSLAFSPDGNYLGVSGSSSWIVDVRKKSRRRVDRVGSFSPGGSGPELLLLQKDRIALLHGAVPKPIWERAVGAIQGKIARTVLAPGGKFLVYTTERPRGCGLLDLKTAKTRSIGRAYGNTTDLHWDARGRFFLRGWTYGHHGDAGNVFLADTQGKELWKDSPSRATVAAVRFSPDGKRFVWSSVSGLLRGRPDPRVHLIDTATREEAAEATAKVVWWRFLSNKRALSHDHNEFTVWDVAGLRPVQTLKVPKKSWIRHAGFSRPGRWLAVADVHVVRVFAVR